MGSSVDVELIKADSTFLVKYPYFHEVLKRTFDLEKIFGIDTYVWLDTDYWDIGYMDCFSDHDGFIFDTNHPEIKSLEEEIKNDPIFNVIDDPGDYIGFMTWKLRNEKNPDYKWISS